MPYLVDISKEVKGLSLARVIFLQKPGTRFPGPDTIFSCPEQLYRLPHVTIFYGNEELRSQAGRKFYYLPGRGQSAMEGESRGNY